MEKSRFIAEINNEKEAKNASYAENLSQLENFVMIMHESDTMVEPKESEHFEFYMPGQAAVISSSVGSGSSTRSSMSILIIRE